MPSLPHLSGAEVCCVFERLALTAAWEPRNDAARSLGVRCAEPSRGQDWHARRHLEASRGINGRVP